MITILNNSFLFEYISKIKCVPVMTKLDFQHHYSSLQCHMSLEKSFLCPALVLNKKKKKNIDSSMVIIIIMVNVSYYYGKGTPLPHSTHVTAHTQTYVRWYVGQTAITHS